MSDINGTALNDAEIAILRTLASLEELTGVAIVGELEALVPGVLAHADQAGAELKAAESALEGPQEAIALLDAETLAFGQKVAELRAQLESAASPGERAEIRFRLHAYDDELSSLRDKRRQAEEDIQPLIAHRDEARASGDKALSDVEYVMSAIADPLGHVLAQATRAYRNYRAPMLPWLVLLHGDDAHPEWGPAIHQMTEVCKISGYRTEDHRDELPSDAEHHRRTWDNARKSAPVPGGSEIIAGMHADMFNSWLGKLSQRGTGGTVEDRRRPAIPRPELDYKSPLRKT